MQRRTRGPLAFFALLAVIVGASSLGGVSVNVQQSTGKNAAVDVSPVFQHSSAVPGAVPGHDAIADTVEQLFATATEGSRVDISIFTLADNEDNTNDRVDQLLDSVQSSVKGRRLDLHVSLDDKKASPKPPNAATCSQPRPVTAGGWSGASVRLWCIATVNGTKPQRVTVCVDACNGPRQINHNKFVVFESVVRTSGSGTEPVVFSSSANWNVSELTNQSEHALVIRGDADLTAAFRTLAGDLKDDRTRANYGANHGRSSGPLQAYFFPFETSGPWQDDLDRLRCPKGAGSIRILSNIMGIGDGTLIKQLRDRRAAGCDVRVLLKNKSENVEAIEALIAAPSGKQIQARCTTNLHAKTMILTGTWASGNPAKATWDGSKPIGDSLVADNVVLRVSTDTITDQYIADHDIMWNSSRPCDVASMRAAARDDFDEDA